jgi:hypothetical protein
MALAFLCNVNCFAEVGLWRVWMYGRPLIGALTVADKGAALLVAGLIAWGHVAYAKKRGLYHKTGPAMSAHWVRPFVTYCVLTVLMFVSVLLAAYLTGTHRLN